MRTQIKFSYQISIAAKSLECPAIADQWYAFYDAVIEEASALCGGCTVLSATGYWTEGETRASRFGGPVQRETCLSLDLTTETDKAETVYADMQAEIKRLVQANRELQIQWIHCNRSEVIGMHFDASI